MVEEKLVDEIESQRSVDFDSGRSNHLWDLGLTIGAIVSSFVAAVLAGTSAPVWLTAAVAALPGLFAATQRVIDFRGRAAWYFMKSTRALNIVLAMKHEDLSVADASKQYRQLNKEMEKQWSDFSRSGSTPPQSSTQNAG